MSDPSPYGSPTSAVSDRERGRSPQRFGGKVTAGTSSPLRPMVSSPLARVTEEAPAPLKLHTDLEPLKQVPSRPPLDKLVSVETPRNSGDSTSSIQNGKLKENRIPETANGKVNGITHLDSGIGEMKTVDI